MQTAAEIAAQFAPSQYEHEELELAILRHMEHHALHAAEAEREACAKIADASAAGVKAGSCSHGTASLIAEAIRARGAVNT